MKRLTLLAAIVFLLAFILVASPVSANPSWASYNDPDRQTTDDDFTGDETTVYMQGNVTANTTFQVVYYEADTDGAGTDDEADRLVTENQTSNAEGTLESELYFPDYPAAGADTWHSVVFEDGSVIPDVYNATADGIVEDDTFDVQASAIPEFPTVITMMVAIGLSFGIYYWMRRRYHRQVVTVKPE